VYLRTSTAGRREDNVAIEAPSPPRPALPTAGSAEAAERRAVIASCNAFQPRLNAFMSASSLTYSGAFAGIVSVVMALGLQGGAKVGGVLDNSLSCS
jgi:hypothetical protein